jgi:hypothetical protein
MSWFQIIFVIFAIDNLMCTPFLKVRFIYIFMQKKHRIAKKVKCNGLVKRWTLDRLQSLTYMTIGEVYDCCEIGGGVLSKMDSDTLTAIERLNGLLRKIDFPQNVNKKFEIFLKSQRESYRQHLHALNESVSAGVLPIYYSEVFKRCGRVDDQIINHERVQQVFKKILLNYIDHGFDLWPIELEQKYRGNNHSNTYVNPKTRYERFLKSFHDDTHDDGRSRKQQILDDAYNALVPFLNDDNLELAAIDDIDVLLDKPQNEEEFADENLYEESQVRLLFDDRYSFTTQFDYDFSLDALSKRFRTAVEYICTIPSRANPMLLWQILEDCRIIEELSRWKKYLKANKSDKSLISDTEFLIATYNNIMNGFKIPTIRNRVAKEEFDYIEWQFCYYGNPFNPITPNTYVTGVTCMGVEVYFEFYIAPDILNLIQREKHNICGYRFSKDNNKKDIYLMYSKYKMDFLIRYLGLEELDKELQKAGLNELCRLWLSENVLNIVSLNGRFFEYYDIEVLVQRCNDSEYPVCKPL